MPVVTNFSDLDLSKQYTYADYLLWQFSERVELIRGFIKKMSPAPKRIHQEISHNISGIFYSNFRHQSCKMYTAPFDVRLPIPSKKRDMTVVQPDICIVCDKSKLDEAGCNGAPDLIIEILSPGNTKHDVDTKFSLYEEAGVKEYWMVEPLEKLVFIYTLQNEKYIGLKPFSEDETIKSPLFPDLQISLKDIFEDI